MKIKILLLALFLGSLTNLFADWTFKNGTFSINGDTSFYISPSSSLYLQDFGYYLNDSRRFHRIEMSQMNNLLNFQDGDKVTFVKKGLFFDYYTTESATNLYTISSRGTGGLTIPFTFSLTSNSVSPTVASGQPLPTVLVTMLFALAGGAWLFVRKKKNS